MIVFFILIILEHIRKKLFSIKPKNVHDNPTKNVNCVHRAIFDVYFPNNKEAKTKLLAPDFRVIVFKYGKLY